MNLLLKPGDFSRLIVNDSVSSNILSSRMVTFTHCLFSQAPNLRVSLPKLKSISDSGRVETKSIYLLPTSQSYNTCSARSGVKDHIEGEYNGAVQIRSEDDHTHFHLSLVLINYTYLSLKSNYSHCKFEKNVDSNSCPKKRRPHAVNLPSSLIILTVPSV